jgi:beta-phosphoglucomutase
VRARAVIFDFNGTLSDDEPLLAEIFSELFAEQGKPLSAQEYFDELVGLSDREIVRTWLGPDYTDIDAVVRERVARFRAAVPGGATIPETAREAVRYAAGRVPVAVVSGAARDEMEPVLAAAGLVTLVRGVMAAEDVERGKPDPEGYVRALSLLGDEIAPEDVVVFEDTEAGVAAAKAAGMRCVAVLGTVAPDRLRAADAIVRRIDMGVVRRFVGD